MNFKTNYQINAKNAFTRKLYQRYFVAALCMLQAAIAILLENLGDSKNFTTRCFYHLVKQRYFRCQRINKHVKQSDCYYLTNGYFIRI